MATFLIGVLAMGAFWWIVSSNRDRGVKLRWWGWLLTLFELGYCAFVLQAVATLLGEGAPRAALVLGMLLGIFAIVGAVLLRRFVWVKRPA